MSGGRSNNFCDWSTVSSDSVSLSQSRRSAAPPFRGIVNWTSSLQSSLKSKMQFERETLAGILC